MRTDTAEDWSEDEIERLRTALNDDDKLRLDKLRAALNDKLRAAAQTAAEAVAIKDRVAGELRARRTARLAHAALRQCLGSHSRSAASASRQSPACIRQMKRAGVEVAGCEIQRDGTVKVVTGKPSEATTTDDNNKTATNGMGCCDDETATEVRAGLHRPQRPRPVLLPPHRLQAGGAAGSAVVAAFMEAYEPRWRDSRRR